jgi:Flp pilus assembly protein TadD
MHRQPLRSVAVSALAVWAAGCAGTQIAPSASTASPAKPATATPPAAQHAVVASTEASLDTELARAQSLRAQGNFAEATHVLGQLVLVAPDDARVVGEYGKVLVQQGRSDDAVAFLKRATELKAGDWTLYSALGVAYDQMDDRKDAKVAYERALALRPGDSTVLNNYAVSRMLAGDLDGAQRLLAQAQAGGGNPKVASNLQLLAQMRAKAGVASPKTSAPTRVANGAARPASTSTASNASASPKPLSPKPLLPQPATVVMQQVPADPHAGPTRVAAKTPRKTVTPPPAKSKLAKSVPQKSALPALRTADQGE